MAVKPKHKDATRTATRCFYCGTLERCTHDHFIPQSKGGTRTVPACAVCQMTKRDMMPLDFAEYMEKHPAIKQSAARRIREAVNFLLKTIQE